MSDTEGMRQYAPYPDELAALVATMRLTVHPSWQFSLDDLERDPAATHSGAAGGLTFRVLAETRDAYQERLRSVIHYFPVPAATFNRTSWQRWLLDRLLDIQRHEVCEGLLFDEQRPFAPTHGPGDDPYIIVQYASDEQRRTSFRGEVKP